MTDEPENLVLQILREMRQADADFRLETQQNFSHVRADISRLDVRVNKVGQDVRELSLQTALLETRMAKVMDFIVEHDRRLNALEAQ
jgi:hypothetical protein